MTIPTTGKDMEKQEHKYAGQNINLYSNFTHTHSKMVTIFFFYQKLLIANLTSLKIHIQYGPAVILLDL